MADSARLTPGFNTRGPAGGASWVGRGIIVSLRTVADRERRPLLCIRRILCGRGSCPPPPHPPTSQRESWSKERNANAHQQVKVKSSQGKMTFITRNVDRRQGAHSAIVSSGEKGRWAAFCRIRP